MGSSENMRKDDKPRNANWHRIFSEISAVSEVENVARIAISFCVMSRKFMWKGERAGKRMNSVYSAAFVYDSDKNGVFFIPRKSCEFFGI